jgi:hypothetical protein
MHDAITSREFPKCSRLGVLRKTNSKRYVVSTAALHDALGWPTYEKYLPLMEHVGNGCPTADSCEEFLRGLNGQA